MPRNGSGTFQLVPGINPVVTQTLITSDWANTTLNDIAAGITQSLSRDGQSLPTANLPMSGFRHTGAGNPVNAQDYTTLLYVQQGRHARVSSVMGSNSISGQMDGNPTSLQVGQIISIVPTSTNTGPVTLTIGTIPAAPVISGAGSELQPGSFVAGQPYLIMWDGSNYVVQAGGPASSVFAQGAISGWRRPDTTTYQPLTRVSDTQVSIPAGTGYIITPSSVDFSGVQEVSWTAQNVTLINLGSSWITTLGIDSTGTVVQLPGAHQPIWDREYIILGTAVHVNGAITVVNTAPNVFCDVAYLARDLASQFDGDVISGGTLSGNATSPLHLDRAASVFFRVGGAPNAIDNVNNLSTLAVEDLEFYPITGAGTASAKVQNVPVTMYDPNGDGSVTAIPGGAQTATVFRLFWLDGEYLLLYGQTTWPDLETAVDNLTEDSVATTIPSQIANATLLGFIIAEKGCLDLKDTNTAMIITGSASGGVGGGGGGGGGVPEAPTDGFLYGRINATWEWAAPLPRGTAGTFRTIPMYTGTSKRGAIGLDDTAEAGSNTGSDLIIQRYNDAGTVSGVPVRIRRSDGRASLETRPLFNGNLAWDAGNLPSPVQIGETVRFASVAIGDDSSSTISEVGGLFAFSSGISTPSVTVGTATLTGPGGVLTASGGIADSVGNLRTGTGGLDSKLSTSGGRIQSLSVGDDSDILLYESSANRFSVRAGPSSAYVFWFFDPTGDLVLNNGGVNAVTHFFSSGGSAVLSVSGGPVYLRPNGPASTTGQVSVSTGGDVTVHNYVNAGASGGEARFGHATLNTWFGINSTNMGFYDGGLSAWQFQVVRSSGNCIARGNITGGSDINLKDDIREAKKRNILWEFRLHDFTWKTSGQFGTSVVAQEVQMYAPDLVEDTGEFLAVNKIDLALILISELRDEISRLKRPWYMKLWAKLVGG